MLVLNTAVAQKIRRLITHTLQELQSTKKKSSVLLESVNDKDVNVYFNIYQMVLENGKSNSLKNPVFSVRFCTDTSLTKSDSSYEVTQMYH